MHVLSTPPAFNLSQNQTLQFKSVAKISVGTEIRISKFFPTRSSLVNEPCALSFGARSVSTLPFAACQLLFSIFRKFLFGIAGSFSPPRNSFLIRFYENFASPVKTFFQFRDTFASLAVRLNRRRRTLRRCPPFVKLFVESFLFFLIEGGGNPLSLARKGFPFPPQTPPCPSQTRFILVNVTARRCRGFPLFAVPR